LLFHFPFQHSLRQASRVPTPCAKQAEFPLLDPIESNPNSSNPESSHITSNQLSRVTSPPINQVKSNFLQSIESSQISSNQSSLVTSPPINQVESNLLLQSIESSQISSNQSSRVTSPRIPIESSPNQNEQAPNHRLRPRRVHSTLQPLQYRYDTQMLLDCASLITSTDATHASLTRILDVFCSELAGLPANAPRPPLQWEVPHTTNALRTTADSYAHAILLLYHMPISARRGILHLARTIRSPHTPPADLPDLIDTLSEPHQTLVLLEPIESSPTP
jgi:hypothetical protein